MEYCSGGELFEQVAGTSRIVRKGGANWDTEERLAALFRQMIAAFRYIHRMGIVHRDNKLANWVFASPDQDRIKLIDFGFATEVDPADAKPRELCGTCDYVAPEMLVLLEDQIVEGSGYDEKVDIWAFGVMLYMLVSGEPLFVGDNEDDILRKIGRASSENLFSGRLWRNVSAECKDIISRCLHRDP